MLPKLNRLRRSSDFARAARLGSSARRGGVIAHVYPRGSLQSTRSGDPTRVGLIVGRPVGGAVQRHRLSRQLRVIAGRLLGEIPDTLDVVLRPTPASASLSFAELSADVGAAVHAACRKACGQASCGEAR